MAIILEKTGDKHRIDLRKQNEPIKGEIKINLNWNATSGKGIDLDLGCFYELKNGKKRLIDGLQFSHGRGGTRDNVTNQGCYTQAPYIWHKGDDRDGSSDTGETFLINPEGLSQIKRVIVYAFIFEGVARWSETDAQVQIIIPGHEDILVKLGDLTSNLRFCALASIENEGINNIEIKKLMTFHNSHSDCDKCYEWGFKYNIGSK